MKLFVVILAVVALAQGAKLKSHKLEHHKNGGITDDVAELMKLMPMEELAKIVHKYENDVNEVSEYLLSKEAVKAKEAILLLPEMQELMQYVNDLFNPTHNATTTDTNENIDEDINNHANKHLHKNKDKDEIKNEDKDVDTDSDSDLETTAKPISHKSKKDKKISSRTGGYNAYMKEVMEIFPMEEVKEFFVKKAKEGALIGKLYTKMQGMEKFFNNLITIPEVAVVVEHLEELGLDFEKMWEYNKEFFDWH